MDESDAGYWDAYSDLHRGRSMGFSSLNPITISDILQWLDLHGILNEEIRLDYYEVISRLDFKYRNWLIKKSKSKESK